MKTVVAAIMIFFIVSSATAAPDCDCTTYPFKPNPPCYGRCIAHLSREKNLDLSKIKNLDPGVSVNIKVLYSNPDKSKIDFSKIQDKRSLEGVTLKSLENKNIKFESRLAVDIKE